MNNIIKILYNIFLRKKDEIENKKHIAEFINKRGNMKRPYRLISKKGLKKLQKDNKYFVAYICVTDGNKTIVKQFPLTPGDMIPSRLPNIGEYCLRMCLANWSSSEDPNMWSAPPFKNKHESRRVFKYGRNSYKMKTLEKKVSHIAPLIRRL